MSQELTADVDVSALEDDPRLCHVIQYPDVDEEEARLIIDELEARLPESEVVLVGVSLDDVDSLDADELRELASAFEAQADAMDDAE